MVLYFAKFCQASSATSPCFTKILKISGDEVLREALGKGISGEELREALTGNNVPLFLWLILELLAELRDSKMKISILYYTYN